MNETLSKEEFLNKYQIKEGTLHKEGLIICESRRIIEKAHQVGIHFLCLCCKDEDFSYYKELYPKDNLFSLSEGDFDKLCKFKFHRGIIGIAKRPSLPNINDMKGPAVFINGLSKSENVGAIIRSCSGFDIKNLIFDKKSCSPYLKRALRTSMGNTFFTNIYSDQNFDSISILKKKGYQIIATANASDAKNVHEVSFQENTVFIIGSEGHGIEEELMKQCDLTCKIEITPKVAHLNAACAASIFFYQYSLIRNFS